MSVKVKGANRYKKEKNSVCTVCSLRGLRFGVTDTRYSNVTCTVRDRQMKSRHLLNVKELDTSFELFTKINQFSLYIFGDCLFWGCLWKLSVEFSWFYDGIYDIYSSGQVVHGTLIKRFFF